MEPLEVPSQPEVQIKDIISDTFKGYSPEPPALADVAPQADEPEEAEPIESFDPATIRIPNKQFTPNVPKSLEKFKDKSLVEFATSYEEAERAMHAKAKEAADARRENEELKSRLAAAEQFARMTPQQQPQQPQYDPYAGINPDEAIITDPRRVLNATLTESQRIARGEAERAAKAAVGQLQSEMQRERDGQTIVAAFELARTKLSQQLGREIPVEEWQQDLQYIAPVVMRENESRPGRMFDHNAYVEHAQRIKGFPKASVPVEGNAPIASRPASVKNESNVPTLDRESQKLKRQIEDSLAHLLK